MPPRITPPRIRPPKISGPKLGSPKLPTIPPADWQRVLQTGMQFTELRRSQARSLVKDLVAQGHVARDQMGAAVDEVLDLSRRRSDDLRKLVQNEVQRQLGAIGLVTKADLAAVERRLARTASAPARKPAPAKKAPAKKAAIKKAAIKKAGAKMADAQPRAKKAASSAAPKAAHKAV